MTVSTFANRIRGISFLWLCLAVGVVSVLLISMGPVTYDASWAAIGLALFAPLFVVQVASGVALDNWWVASIERKERPYSYWWRVVAWGLGAAGFAYRVFVPLT